MTTLREKLAALRLRIGAAESQRDTWRAAGSQEKYLEACSLVDALELQLATLEQSTAVVAGATSPQHSDDAVASQMAELRIRFDGRAYHYRQYRYDRFIDAVNYARLGHERGLSAPPGEEAPLEQVPLPTEADRALMRALAISFEGGAFRWREHRYDRLADAVAYATRHGGPKPTVAG
jgi:hypothetical protein